MDTLFWGLKDRYFPRGHIVKCKAPVFLAVQRYNQRAVSVLSYLGQFSEPEIDVAALQQVAIHKVLRLPPNSLSREAVFGITLFAGISPFNLTLFLSACMFRVAFSKKNYLKTTLFSFGRVSNLVFRTISLCLI